LAVAVLDAAAQFSTTVRKLRPAQVQPRPYPPPAVY
jgi:hypothetical protein